MMRTYNSCAHNSSCGHTSVRVHSHGTDVVWPTREALLHTTCPPSLPHHHPRHNTSSTPGQLAQLLPDTGSAPSQLQVGSDPTLLPVQRWASGRDPPKKKALWKRVGRGGSIRLVLRAQGGVVVWCGQRREVTAVYFSSSSGMALHVTPQVIGNTHVMLCHVMTWHVSTSNTYWHDWNEK